MRKQAKRKDEVRPEPGEERAKVKHVYAVGSEILIRLNEITFMLDEIINRPKWYEFWKRDGVIMAAAQGALMKKNAIDTVKSVLSKAKGLIKRIF